MLFYINNADIVNVGEHNTFGYQPVCVVNGVLDVVIK